MAGRSVVGGGGEALQHEELAALDDLLGGLPLLNHTPPDLQGRGREQGCVGDNCHVAARQESAEGQGMAVQQSRTLNCCINAHTFQYRRQRATYCARPVLTGCTAPTASQCCPLPHHQHEQRAEVKQPLGTHPLIRPHPAPTRESSSGSATPTMRSLNSLGTTTGLSSVPKGASSLQ